MIDSCVIHEEKDSKNEEIVDSCVIREERERKTKKMRKN